MFACICYAVTRARLQAVIDAGAHSLEAVEARCGAGGDCGACRAEIAEVLCERLKVGRTDSEAA
jgi:bacterioferritin-associated ferredoxin